MTVQVKPVRLAAGAKIGVVNPAYWLEPKRQHRAVSVFEDLGYQVVLGKTIDEIVLDVCGDRDFPIISNFPCGHGTCQATLPVSHEIELHALEDNPYILVPESPVA